MASPEVVINQLVIKQAASLAATGASIPEISTQLGMSKYHVKKVMANPEFKALIKEIGDEAVNNAKQVIRSKTGNLANKVMDVISSRLDDGDLEAVKVALKVIGFDQQDVGNRGDTQINVVLPGSKGETVVHSTIETTSSTETDNEPI